MINESISTTSIHAVEEQAMYMYMYCTCTCTCTVHVHGCHVNCALQQKLDNITCGFNQIQLQ